MTNTFIELKKFYIHIVLLLIVFSVKAQDTITSVDLDSVSVRAERIELKQNVPSGDKLNIKHLKTINTQNAGDAAKFLGGVLVKDYGGLGGVKTVSVRGLSSNHTSVLYDGVNLFDNQSGQIDLSKYSLSSMNSLSLANAQFNSFLPTATSLASASSVSIETKKPNMGSKQLMGDIALTYGSFNLFSGNLFLASKVSNRDVVTFLTDITNTNGRYPYKIYYGVNQSLATKKMKRENNDMFSYHGEMNWFHSFSARQNLKAKAFYYYSERGLPSNVTLYYQNSEQRLWNKNFFAQTDYTFLLNDRLTYRNHLKFDWNYTRYVDPHYLNSTDGQDDNYTQKLIYMNNAVSFKYDNSFFVTLTNDISFNSLNYTILETVPERFSSLSAIVLNYSCGRFSFVANTVHSFYHDWFNSLQKDRHYLSPYLSIRYSTGNWVSTLFYKNIFRMPTFNELYYRRNGNTELKPEKTNQLSWANIFTFTFGRCTVQPEIDLYYNNVKDKIVAIPINQFLWSMLNYGKVNIYGTDIKLTLDYVITPYLKTDIKLNYSYQKAVDMQEDSYTYKQNLPYMPENVASAVIGLDYKSWRSGYTCLIVDKRWSLQENLPSNLLKAYADHSLNISYNCKIKHFGFKNMTLTAAVNNIFNHQYEIIRSYPMMGRNFTFKVSADF
ncbi:MAG: TonB-dependent receptor plug domain-containing protein [Bacteroidales bacterium]|nr:TonB-dependent receptor plug domain-containing protein [Bacteroidales bacterium]